MTIEEKQKNLDEMKDEIGHMKNLILEYEQMLATIQEKEEATARRKLEEMRAYQERMMSCEES